MYNAKYYNLPYINSIESLPNNRRINIFIHVIPILFRDIYIRVMSLNLYIIIIRRRMTNTNNIAKSSKELWSLIFGHLLLELKASTMPPGIPSEKENSFWASMIDYFANMQTKRRNCPEKRRRKGRRRKKEEKSMRVWDGICKWCHLYGDNTVSFC